MSTRRSLPWLLLFVIVLPTVMATADTVQRAQDGGASVATPHLRTNSVFVYDLDVETLEGTHDGHYADYVRVEIGEPELVTRLDGTVVEALPVTSRITYTQFDIEHLGSLSWSSRNSEAMVADLQTTTHYAVADGRPVLTISDSHQETWDAEGTHNVMDRHSVDIRGWNQIVDMQRMAPGGRYLDANILTYMITDFLQTDVGHVKDRGLHDGRPAYQVLNSDWDSTDTDQSQTCYLQGLDVYWSNQDTRQAWDGKKVREESQRRAWITNEHPLPVVLDCSSHYWDQSGQKIGAWDVRATLRVLDEGDEPVRIPFQGSRGPADPLPVATPVEPAHPGLPATGGLDIAITSEAAIAAVLAHDEERLKRFGNDATEEPYVVTSASYHPGPRDRPADPDEDTDAPGPLGPLPPSPVPSLPANPGTGDAPVTHDPQWRLQLNNMDGKTLTATVRGTVHTDGSKGPLVVELSERTGTTDNRPVIRDMPHQLVTFAAIHDRMHQRLGRDPAAFDDDPGSALGHSVGMGKMRTNNDPWETTYRTTMNGRATLSTPAAADFDPDHSFSTFLDSDTGIPTSEVAERPETDTAPQPAQSRLAPSSSDRVTLTPYVPTAAVASGFVVALAFLVTYGWTPLKHAALHGLVSPLYAKLRKDKVLDHGTRQAIADYVDANPGATVSEVRRFLKVGYGTTVHHLDTLVRNGLLATEKEGRERHYYALGDIDASRRVAVALVRNAAARRVLEAILAAPGCTQRDVARRLEVAPSSVRFQAKKLIEAGLVRAEDKGRTVHYFVDDDAYARACKALGETTQTSSSVAPSAAAASS